MRDAGQGPARSSSPDAGCAARPGGPIRVKAGVFGLRKGDGRIQTLFQNPAKQTGGANEYRRASGYLKPAVFGFIASPEGTLA